MNNQTQTTEQIAMPYSTLGKDAQLAVLIVSVIANLAVFIGWLAIELTKAS